MKYQLSKSSIYIEGTDVPKNKFNLSDAKFIYTLEKKLLDEAYQKISSKINSQTVLDENYFINLHKKTFESLYDFAGYVLYANIILGIKHLSFADLCWDEGNPTLRAFK